MKRKLTIIVLFCIVIVSLCSCTDAPIKVGTYQSENDARQKVIVTKETIRFVNVSFDELNDEIYHDMGVNLQLTNFLKEENAYFCKGGKISVDISFGIALSFEYDKNHIIINGEKFKLC